MMIETPRKFGQHVGQALAFWMVEGWRKVDRTKFWSQVRRNVAKDLGADQ